jgi:hypothetical protein
VRLLVEHRQLAHHVEGRGGEGGQHRWGSYLGPATYRGRGPVDVGEGGGEGVQRRWGQR